MDVRNSEWAKPLEGQNLERTTWKIARKTTKGKRCKKKLTQTAVIRGPELKPAKKRI